MCKQIAIVLLNLETDKLIVETVAAALHRAQQIGAEESARRPGTWAYAVCDPAPENKHQLAKVVAMLAA